jgi:hypothetical protein
MTDNVKQLVESTKHMDPMDIFDVLMGKTNNTVVDRLNIEYCSLEGRLVRDLQQNEMSDSDIETVIQCLRGNVYLEAAE